MSADISVVFNHLPKIASGLDRGIMDVINRGILTAEAASVPLVPVLSGALRGNRTVELATSGDLNATLTFNQDYAAAVHDGTATMIARPYARMGLDQAVPGVEADLARLVEG